MEGTGGRLGGPAQASRTGRPHRGPTFLPSKDCLKQLPGLLHDQRHGARDGEELGQSLDGLKWPPESSFMRFGFHSEFKLEACFDQGWGCIRR